MEHVFGHGGTIRILSLVALFGLMGCQLDRTPQEVVDPTAITGDGDGDSTQPEGGMPDGGDPCEDCGPECTDPSCQRMLGQPGDGCRTNSQCESSNCRNGLCCEAGKTCCRQASECGEQSGIGPVCTEPETCQGQRGVAICENFACSVSEGSQDDTGCTTEVEANDCGPFPSVYCNGEIEQPVPACETTCETNAECDGSSFCQDDVCVEKLDNGSECDGRAQCKSDYCSRGYCCIAGDCCRTASDCSASFGTVFECDDAAACRGHREEPICDSFQCSVSSPIPDDTGCDSSKTSSCGLYAPTRCNGMMEQTAPTCASTCEDDGDCAGDAYCDTGEGTCTTDGADGSPCSRDDQCESDHCANGFCCQGPTATCCAASTDCPDQKSCEDLTMCSGLRKDGVCEDNVCGLSNTEVEDDSGCSGMTARNCPDNFADFICNDDVDQTVEACRTVCTVDAHCADGFSCSGGACQ